MKKILQVYEMFTSYDGTTFVYALSYSLLLALAPLTALLVVFFRSSPAGLASILDFAEQYIPQDLLSPFIDFFLGNSPVELIPLIFFIVVSLWGRIAGNLFFLNDFPHIWTKWSCRCGSCAVYRWSISLCCWPALGLNGLCSPAIPVYRVTDADCCAVRGVLHLLPAVVVS